MTQKVPKTVRDFIDGLVGRSPNTLENYESFARVFWRSPPIAGKGVQDVEVSDILRFLKWGQDAQGWRLSTMRQYAGTAQRFFSEWMPDAFMTQLKKEIRNLPHPSRYADLYEGIYVRSPDIDPFIDAAPRPEYATAFTMSLKWGLRLSEALRMALDDLDHDALRVTVRGKGSGMEHKTRPVLVDPDSLHAVTDFAKAHSRKRNASIITLSERSLQYAVKDTAKAIGIDYWRKLRYHSLRHSYAIDFLIRRKSEGMPALVLLKNQLGHSDINTTMIYLDIAGTEARDVFDAGFRKQ